MNPNAWNYDKAEIEDDISFLESNNNANPVRALIVGLIAASTIGGVIWWSRKHKSS